jgi:hypothetical protein
VSIGAETSPVKAPVSSWCMFCAKTVTPVPSSTSAQGSSAVKTGQTPISARRSPSGGISPFSRSQYSAACALVPQSFQLPATRARRPLSGVIQRLQAG